MSHLIIATVLYIAIVAIAYRPKSVNVSVTVNYFPEVEEIETDISGISGLAIASKNSSVIPSPWEEETDTVSGLETQLAIATELVKPTLASAQSVESVTNNLESLSIRQLKKIASQAKIKRYSSMNKKQLITAIAN